MNEAEVKALIQDQQKRLDAALDFFLKVAEYFATEEQAASAVNESQALRLSEKVQKLREPLVKYVKAGLPAAQLRAKAKSEGPIKDLFDKLGL